MDAGSDADADAAYVARVAAILRSQREKQDRVQEKVKAFQSSISSSKTPVTNSGISASSALLSQSPPLNATKLVAVAVSNQQYPPELDIKSSSTTLDSSSTSPRSKGIESNSLLSKENSDKHLAVVDFAGSIIQFENETKTEKSTQRSNHLNNTNTNIFNSNLPLSRFSLVESAKEESSLEERLGVELLRQRVERLQSDLAQSEIHAASLSATIEASQRREADMERQMLEALQGQSDMAQRARVAQRQLIAAQKENKTLMDRLMELRGLVAGEKEKVFPALPSSSDDVAKEVNINSAPKLNQIYLSSTMTHSLPSHLLPSKSNADYGDDEWGEITTWEDLVRFKDAEIQELCSQVLQKEHQIHELSVTAAKAQLETKEVKEISLKTQKSLEEAMGALKERLAEAQADAETFKEEAMSHRNACLELVATNEKLESARVASESELDSLQPHDTLDSDIAKRLKKTGQKPPSTLCLLAAPIIERSSRLEREIVHLRHAHSTRVAKLQSDLLKLKSLKDDIEVTFMLEIKSVQKELLISRAAYDEVVNSSSIQRLSILVNKLLNVNDGVATSSALTDDMRSTMVDEARNLEKQLNRLRSGQINAGEKEAEFLSIKDAFASSRLYCGVQKLWTVLTQRRDVSLAVCLYRWRFYVWMDHVMLRVGTDSVRDGDDSSLSQKLQSLTEQKRLLGERLQQERSEATSAASAAASARSSLENQCASLRTELNGVMETLVECKLQLAEALGDNDILRKQMLRIQRGETTERPLPKGREAREREREREREKFTTGNKIAVPGTSGSSTNTSSTTTANSPVRRSFG